MKIRFVLLVVTSLMSVRTARPQDSPPASRCVASDFVNAGGEPDWTVTCSITMDGEKVYEHEQPMAHPAERKEVFRAIDEFMKRKGPEIVKASRKKRQQAEALRQAGAHP